MTEILDSRLFCGMVINAAAAVESRSQEINELNVFPVPPLHFVAIDIQFVLYYQPGHH